MRHVGIAFISSLLALSITHAIASEKSVAEYKLEYVRPGSIPFPKNNLYTKEKARLGEILFFDPRLSGANWMSCSTCHNPGFSWEDGLPRALGDKLQTLNRRTPTLWNLAWADRLMWDGLFRDLEEQALAPMRADFEMNQDLGLLVEELNAIQGYRPLFKDAFPKEGITQETIAKALATYQRTLFTGVAQFDKWIADDEGAILEAAKRGFKLFNTKANCAACHSGWNFTDNKFHDIGLPDDDIGRGKLIPGVTELAHAFKTPTLRNITLRGPFMHNGSLTNLEAVIDHYSDDFVRRPSLSKDMKEFRLTGEDVADLLAFLETLTGDRKPVPHPVLPR